MRILAHPFNDAVDSQSNESFFANFALSLLLTAGFSNEFEAELLGSLVICAIYFPSKYHK